MLQSALVNATLDQHAYTAANSTAFQWPTLHQLMDDGTRAILFSDTVRSAEYDPTGAALPWVLPTYDYCWSSTDSAVLLDDLTCIPTKGTNGTNKLSIFTNALTRPAPALNDARDLSSDEKIQAGVDLCRNTNGLQPNFVSLAWAEVQPVQEYKTTGIDYIRNLNK